MALPRPNSPPPDSASSGRSSGVSPGNGELTGAPGRLIADRYRLEALLGKGGMGEVWRATHVVTRRQVAIKLLRRALDHRPEMRRRFLREARTAAAVSHQNVVEVLDVFEIDDGVPVMVMPLLEGETLASRIAREGPLPLQSALELMLPVIAAVATAHRRRVVHRDLKPDNVFLTRQGVKVLDFGIAKLALDDPDDPGTLTGTGVLLGTPCYMAPEQAFGERDLDQRVDIWALGATLYETLSGARPIEGENIGQVVRNLMTQGITPLEVVAVDVPEPVRDMVMRMLARDREARPASLDEVFAVLSGFVPESSRAALVEAWASSQAMSVEEETESEPEPAYAPQKADSRPDTSLTATLVSGPAPRSSSRRRVALALGVAVATTAIAWLLTRPSTPAAGLPHATVTAPAPLVVETVPAHTSQAPVLPAKPDPVAAPSASSRPRERFKQAKPTTTKPAPSTKAVVTPAPGLQEEPPF